MIVNKLTNRDELELSVHTTPAPSFSPIVDPTLPSPSKHSLPSVTRIVKGHSGKTVVQNVVDVEDDVLSDEQDGFIISDDEVDKDLHNMPNSNLSVTRLSISSNLSSRSSMRSFFNS